MYIYIYISKYQEREGCEMKYVQCILTSSNKTLTRTIPFMTPLGIASVNVPGSLSLIVLLFRYDKLSLLF